jgi:hypothetical protein
MKDSLADMRKEFTHHIALLAKMEECKTELKQMLLNNLICLDFYKDLEAYLNEHRYESPVLTPHFNIISDLIQQHGLHTLDFETERVQTLVD